MNRRNGSKKVSKLYNSYNDSSSNNTKDKGKHAEKHNNRSTNNQIPKQKLLIRIIRFLIKKM